MTDIPGDASTTVSVSVGGTITDTLEAAGDHDWIAITLTAGQPVVISLDGITLHDPYLYIRDSSGTLLFQDDDISSGVDLNSEIAFNPGYSGTYYIDVGAYADAGSGTYQVSVQPYTPPAPGTIDQIATQLTTGFWGGDTHHFDVTQGGTITVDISTLNADEQALARAALSEWTDIIGVHFQGSDDGRPDRLRRQRGSGWADRGDRRRVVERDYDIGAHPDLELLGRALWDEPR